MFRTFLPALAALFLLLPAPAQAADAGDGVIGTILEVEGSATVARGKQTVKAAVKTPLHMKDVVTTGEKSRVFILFIDDTEMTLSEKTKLTVDEYVFDPDDSKHNKGRFSVLEGSFKYVSGLLGKKDDPDVLINTSFGNIGIRGTAIWGGRLRDSYGVHVQEGRVRVRNDAGAVDVARGQGTMIKSRREKPSQAAPFPPEAKQFIQSTVFLAGQAMLLQRLAGFRGENMILRGKFKNFQQLQGILPNGALPKGTPLDQILPPQEEPQNGKDRKKKKDKPALPGGLPFRLP